MKIERAIGILLRKKGWTLSIAESCTGGLICDRITDISGSSDYFMGGMITYSNESKERHLGVPRKDIERYGAVSAQVARKMAQGIRKTFGTTFGLSTTGIAGPTGGSLKKPVGLVFVGLSDGRRTMIKKEIFRGSRRKIKKHSAQRSLNHLYDFIIKAAPRRSYKVNLSPLRPPR